MSFFAQAKRNRHALANALKHAYGRCMRYSATVDKVNRQPLLGNFRRQNSNVPAFSSREKMWSFIASRSPGAIDYLEFGVHRGHSILYFANQNRSPDSRVFGFDCFTGLPEDWNSNYRSGHFDTGGRRPETSDSRVSFVVGLFQETLPKFLAEFKNDRRIIVNIGLRFIFVGALLPDQTGRHLNPWDDHHIRRIWFRAARIPRRPRLRLELSARLQGNLLSRQFLHDRWRTPVMQQPAALRSRWERRAQTAVGWSPCARRCGFLRVFVVRPSRHRQ